jgi:hypothetical protein
MRSGINLRAKRATCSAGASRHGVLEPRGSVAFPILLTMIFGTIEFGTYFYVEHNMQAARARRRAGGRGCAGGPARRRGVAAVDRVFSESSLNKMEGFSYDDPIVEVEDNY